MCGRCWGDEKNPVLEKMIDELAYLQMGYDPLDPSARNFSEDDFAYARAAAREKATELYERLHLEDVYKKNK